MSEPELTPETAADLFGGKPKPEPNEEATTQATTDEPEPEPDPEPVEPQPESEPQTHGQTIVSLLAQKAARNRAFLELLHPASSEKDAE